MPTTWARETEPVVEGRVLHIAERPISFEQFLDMTGEDDDVELVKGVMVEKMSANYPHEKRFAWLFWILYGYVQQRRLGTVLGSRSAVEIDQFGGRLPDVLFVAKEREFIIRDRAIYGAPDLVIEIVSPNARPGELRTLEADYRSIGVAEIVFWDCQKRCLTVLHKREGDYEVQTLTEGEWRSETVEGFHLDVASMFEDVVPNEMDVLQRLLAGQ